MGEEVRECPRKFVGRDAASIDEVLSAESFLERGLGWPSAGGWADQTAALLEALNFLPGAQATIKEMVKNGETL